jgi:hypothetical protein
MFIVELETGVYIAHWDGDPGRTLVKTSARRFRNKSSAWKAVEQAQEYRDFPNASVQPV